MLKCAFHQLDMTVHNDHVTAVETENQTSHCVLIWRPPRFVEWDHQQIAQCRNKSDFAALRCFWIWVFNRSETPCLMLCWNGLVLWGYLVELYGTEVCGLWVCHGSTAISVSVWSKKRLCTASMSGTGCGRATLQKHFRTSRQYELTVPHPGVSINAVRSMLDEEQLKVDNSMIRTQWYQ